MALDLEKLLAATQFKFETDELGTLLVHGLSSPDLSSLSKEYKNISEADSMEFVRKLTSLVCQQDLNQSGIYTDDRISVEQAKLLKEDELERFSEQFIEKNN